MKVGGASGMHTFLPCGAALKKIFAHNGRTLLSIISTNKMPNFGGNYLQRNLFFG